MRIFQCSCGNALYFENTKCLGCQREAGWCPACRSIAGLDPTDDGHYRCTNAECGALLDKCHNYAVEHVCNRCVPVDNAAHNEGMCDCCVHNDTIPDLSVPGHREKWARLEAAKRRLIYTLDTLGLPHPTAAEGAPLPLEFDFKADEIPRNEFWRAMSKAERVYTGHHNGKITINVREADPLEREKLRVDLEEAHRTLIGHFRHEVGHYYWDLLVRGRREADSVRVFGDHNEPTYADALDHHYQEGPPPDWPSRFVSAYASMHPWEDFAETFATHQDMVAVLRTAENNGFGSVPDVRNAPIGDLVDAYRRLGIAMNEMNRTMGLVDFVPKMFIPPVVEKLAFVHELVQEAAQPA